MNYPYQIKSQLDYDIAYKKSVAEPEKFWAEIASCFTWQKKWDKVLEWDFKTADTKWFIGGKLNITENCIDRHLDKNAETPAIVWEANDPNEKNITLTYKELNRKVCLMANVLKNNDVKKGDRVCLYMGMTVDLAISTLACARIGAIHSVIFGGFSAQAIADRLQDANAEYIITSDGAYRAAKDIALKATIDEALLSCPFVKKVIVTKRTGVNVTMKKGRDIWLADELKKAEENGQTNCPAEVMDAEDPLFILYTSGSTGKPKGVVHTIGGYMVWANYTFVNVFQYKPGQIHFCTADIGWITGHSYILYGPLSAGATSLLFEGVPTWPDAGRFWEIIDKHNVDILYTAPTAIRSLMGYGLDPLKNKKLNSLKVLGSVGEPINEEAWHWYETNIGKGNSPVVDTWWQTETGGIMISNLAGVTPSKPSYATLPLPGVQPCLVDETGKVMSGNNVSGNLCIKFPWPGIIRTTYGDHERCKLTYFTAYENMYFTGDGCLRDAEGNYKITGRVDDVLNVSGHRIGTAEVENAINMHDAIIESAVVGYPHDIKGQGIYAYVICDAGKTGNDIVKQEIIAVVTKAIGPIAKPDKIQFVTGLPKTRSGKIMRRILRKIAEGETTNLGDISTLLDPALVNEIAKGKI